MRGLFQQALAGFLASVVVMVLPAQSQEFVAGQQAKFAEQLAPLLAKHCYECHGHEAAEADLDLEQVDSYRQLLSHRERWLKVLRRVEAGDMPPEDAEQPDDAAREQMVTLLDDLLNELDCEELSQPGHVTIRRLNRREYRNTVRDLTGVDYEPSGEFPGDDVGYGFDNIGDVLSLSPLLLEKYLQAAEEIAAQAIIANPGSPFAKTIPGSELTNVRALGGRWNQGGILVTTGTADIEIEIPKSGKYEIRIKAYGHQAGDEVVRMAMLLDGAALRETDVKAVEQAPSGYTSRVNMEQGKHRVGASFLNDFYDPNAADGNKDRNLCLVSIEIQGPLGEDRADLPESHRRLVFVSPERDGTLDEVSRKVAQRLASRAYRRPAKDDEIQRLAHLIKLAVEEGDTFEAGVQLALQAVLVSPHFLYKVEQPIPAGEPERRLSEFELATSLSYFLWSSMPDDTLLRLAWEEQLSDPAVLQAEVRRMLADPKSKALVDNFAGQWLQLRALESFEADVELFPEFSPELKQAMRQETLLFFAEVQSRDLSLLTLLEADFTYVNEALAKHYGLEGIQGSEFRRVALAGTPRGGLLTQGSILTVTSNPTRTSPVKRGKWVLENLLGTPPPPPAANVMELEAQSQLTGTLREKMQQHRENPSCASCHAQMDPIGFALENFDAVGRWRDRDSGSPVDASGQLPGGQSFRGAIELQRILASERRDLFVRCLSEKMMVYALGRGLEYFDKCTVDQITTRLAANDYRFSELILAIVETDAFQKRSPHLELASE